MSKQLEQLYYKALEKGYANKNGRIYGQSKSDRDALLQIFSYCGRNDFKVSYRPSRDEFYTKVQFVGKKELQEFII